MEAADDFRPFSVAGHLLPIRVKEEALPGERQKGPGISRRGAGKPTWTACSCRIEAQN